MSQFELVLFSVDPAFIRRAVQAGVSTVMVDWETRNKAGRQRGADTEINAHTVDDLRRVRAATERTVLCRINAFTEEATADEVETAIAAGADEVLLPMVQTVAEVEAVLALVAGRCPVGILIETVGAVDAARALARLPLSRVYIGLNDLSIQRRSPTIFEPLVDGTLESLRKLFDVPFGFGGLTLPDRGAPIPCRLLIGELARLDCSFSILRRSFHRDIAGRDLAVEVPRLQLALTAAAGRDRTQLDLDRAALTEAISGLHEEEPDGS